jgi:hypothetical protein
MVKESRVISTKAVGFLANIDILMKIAFMEILLA